MNAHYNAHFSLEFPPAMRKYVRTEGEPVQFETNTAKIKGRLEKEGWQLVGGTKHDKYRKAGFPSLMVPRHRAVTPGVARSIAKAAGWDK